MASLALSVGVVGWFGPDWARGDALGRSYSAVAESSGMYVRYGIPGFVAVDNFIDGGGPVAQAVADSDGGRGSFASLPYPGSTFVGYPGLVSLVSGGAVPTPPGYPFYVSASHPTQPDQSLSDPSGAYSLAATAKETQAAGNARLSPPGQKDASPVSQAQSQVITEGGTVTATAVSVAEGVVIGPLSVGRLRSQSVTTYHDGDQQPVTQTDLTLEGGRAGDTVFSFGRDGFKVAQQGVPVPADQGLKALNQAIAPFGVSVRFDEASPLAGGAVAGAFEIISVADVPGAGKGQFSVRLGGASSLISLGPETGAPVVDQAPSIAVPAGPDSGPGVGQTPAPASTAPTASVADGSGTGPSGFSVATGLSSATGTASSSGLGPPAVSYDAGSNASAGPGTSAQGTPPPGAGLAGGLPAALQPTRLAAAPIDVRDVRATSVLTGLMVAGAVLAVGLVALVTKRRQSWTA